MAAIAGIAVPDGTDQVQKMLEKIAYRGPEGIQIRSIQDFTLGIRWSKGQPKAESALTEDQRVEDAISESHFASAQVSNNKLTLTRDPIGVSPLYYGHTDQNVLCFASEVKALVGMVRDVKEVPPGCSIISGICKPYYHLTTQPSIDETRLTIASGLRHRLIASIEKRAKRGVPFGAWLSGGLDSSIMAAIALEFSDEKMHTFAGGFSNASDLEYARIVAKHLRTEHHEVSPSLREVIKSIPEVIYHLESFDQFMVRSSLMNYLVAKMAADYVPAIFSGEGSDELFGGYAYLRKVSFDDLQNELVDITGRLHNTALQRVDRCSAAFGTVTYVPYLDEEVVTYAMSIPPEYKIFDGYQKWVLRRAVYDLLPQSVVNREKEKFWEGSGIMEHIARMAEEAVSDSDYQQLRSLPDGETLRSKEEAYYYRIFLEYFGELDNFAWMGRTRDTSYSSIRLTG